MPAFHLPHIALRNAVTQSWLAPRLAFVTLPAFPLTTAHRASYALSCSARAYTSSSASSARWKTRQFKDQYARDAKVQGLKSRAAFKLLEASSSRSLWSIEANMTAPQMNQKYRVFKPGNTVVDLGYAPGSWSQVAISQTHPRGRVIGIDIIPAQPPKGVSTIQGDFLSEAVRDQVRSYVQDPDRGRVRVGLTTPSTIGKASSEATKNPEVSFSEEEITDLERGYVDLERSTLLDISSSVSISEAGAGKVENGKTKKVSARKRDAAAGRVVDVVLSDMSEPWDQTTGFWQNSISDPYRRMMNTSGNTFKDHAGSIDLCMAALTFGFDTLKTGGHFVCKFYQGAEDKAFENRLRRLFEKVHREKPDSSRKESKEAYFIALRRRENPTREDVFVDIRSQA